MFRQFHWPSAFVTIFIVGTLLFLACTPQSRSPSAPPQEECIVGDAFFAGKEDGTFVRFGDTELCGTNLHWKGVFGPSITDKIKGLEQELERLKALQQTRQ